MPSVETALTELEQALSSRREPSSMSASGARGAADDSEFAVEPEPAAALRMSWTIEAKLAELRTAEQAFARTHAELAQRSDALAEQEAALAARERALAAKEGPPAGNLDALEARIRRLEQSGRKREAEPQTFSAGLRALQERGLRGGRSPDEPLH